MDAFSPHEGQLVEVTLKGAVNTASLSFGLSQQKEGDEFIPALQVKKAKLEIPPEDVHIDVDGELPLF